MDLTFKPYSEKHAIKQVLFVLEFQSPFSASVLEEIKDSPAHEQLIAELPRFKEGRGVTIGTDSPAMLNFARDSELLHLTYDKLQPNGEPEWAVNVQREILGVTSGMYARWKPSWAFAKKQFELLLPLLFKHSQLGVVGLQVVDEFRSVGPKENFHLSGLFVDGTRFLPANLVGLKTSCHAHHGFFEYCEPPNAGKRLHNINVDVVERPKDFVVQILSSHKHFLGEVEGDVSYLLSDEGPIGSVYKALHAMNKTMVGDMLTQPIKDAINFDGKQEGHHD